MTDEEPARRRWHRPAEPATSSGALVRPFLGHPTAGRTGATGGDVRSAGRSALRAAGASIRPFMVTSGRTAGATDIAVEAQVVITPRGQTAVGTLTFEYRDIVTLCEEPQAVAEIAARLSLHLGVIRVLVGDLEQQGMVITYQPEVDPTDDVETIARVINGLRART